MCTTLRVQTYNDKFIEGSIFLIDYIAVKSLNRYNFLLIFIINSENNILFYSKFSACFFTNSHISSILFLSFMGERKYGLFNYETLISFEGYLPNFGKQFCPSLNIYCIQIWEITKPYGFVITTWYSNEYQFHQSCWKSF